MNEGGLAIPSMYLIDPQKYEKEIDAYKKYISDSAKLVRDSLGSKVADEAIEKDANDLVNFEMSLAKVSSSY